MPTYYKLIKLNSKPHRPCTTSVRKARFGLWPPSSLDAERLHQLWVPCSSSLCLSVSLIEYISRIESIVYIYSCMSVCVCVCVCVCMYYSRVKLSQARVEIGALPQLNSISSKISTELKQDWNKRLCLNGSESVFHVINRRKQLDTALR